MTEYIWEGEVTLGESGRRAAEYLFAPGTFVPLAVFSGDRTAVYDCDPTGLPHSAWHPDGEVAWQADFEPYAELRAEQGDGRLVPFRYFGQYADTETGLAYNRFRYLDPQQRGYTRPDPLGLWGNAGVWEYVPDPLTWADPYGLTCSSDAAKLRANMVNAGQVEPGFPNAAHHLVMSNSTDPRMIAARAHLQTHGVDINAPENGIFLPRSSADAVGTGLPAHSSLHTDAYKQAVHDRITAANNPAEVQQALTDIQNGLKNGTFP
jgi:RHS repeat-associated protein